MLIIKHLFFLFIFYEVCHFYILVMNLLSIKILGLHPKNEYFDSTINEHLVCVNLFDYLKEFFKKVVFQKGILNLIVCSREGQDL